MSIVHYLRKNHLYKKIGKIGFRVKRNKVDTSINFNVFILSLACLQHHQNLQGDNCLQKDC